MRLIHYDSTRVTIEVGQQVYLVPFKHQDDRRTLYEGPCGPGVLQFFVIRDGEPIGKHYHKKTEEEFHLLQGGGFVLTIKVGDNGMPCEANAIRRQLDPGDIELMLPYTAHTFCLEPGTLMACKATLPYDPADVFRTDWLVLRQGYRRPPY